MQQSTHFPQHVFLRHPDAVFSFSYSPPPPSPNAQDGKTRTVLDFLLEEGSRSSLTSPSGPVTGTPSNDDGKMRKRGDISGASRRIHRPASIDRFSLRQNPGYPSSSPRGLQERLDQSNTPTTSSTRTWKKDIVTSAPVTPQVVLVNQGSTTKENNTTADSDMWVDYGAV